MIYGFVSKPPPSFQNLKKNCTWLTTVKWKFRYNKFTHPHQSFLKISEQRDHNQLTLSVAHILFAPGTHSPFNRKLLSISSTEHEKNLEKWQIICFYIISKKKIWIEWKVFFCLAFVGVSVECTARLTVKIQILYFLWVRN